MKMPGMDMMDDMPMMGKKRQRFISYENA